jgi:hypothetical protein
MRLLPAIPLTKIQEIYTGGFRPFWISWNSHAAQRPEATILQPLWNPLAGPRSE